VSVVSGIREIGGNVPLIQVRHLNGLHIVVQSVADHLSLEVRGQRIGLFGVGCRLENIHSLFILCNTLEMTGNGYAVLGLVLESVYGTDYTALVNDYAQSDPGLASTKISEHDGDLGNLWDWEADDAYLSAGALTSDITDMLTYAQMQLNDPRFTPCHESLKTINASTESYLMMCIHMDEIGMAWIIDNENGFIWHNGGTGHYNSYLGFCPETGTAVVVLSNLSPNDRIPATVLGIKSCRN